MNKKTITSFLIFSIFLLLNSCSDAAKAPNTSTESSTSKKATQKTIYASDVIPFFDHWKLILGDGSNAGIANNFAHKDFFYTVHDGTKNWVVYKAPNS